MIVDPYAPIDELRRRVKCLEEEIVALLKRLAKLEADVHPKEPTRPRGRPVSLKT